MVQSNPPETAPQKPETNIHAGHRERVKRRFLEHGAGQLEDHQLLEIILFYSRAQEDVNPLAHRLIDRFGSLKAVLDASPEELKEIPGISDHTATLLKLFPAVMARYQQSTIQPGTIVNTVEEAGDLLRACFVGAQTEKVCLLSVDAKGKLLGCDTISSGTANAVLMDQRRIVQTALRRRASQVFLGHCHVSGLAIPSQEDIWATHRLETALEMMNIRLTDHLVFADDDYLSMAQSGLLKNQQLGG
ncbi:MAG: DNA repair protein RadC [Oscillospiraceae bacterium]|nr:DNA repair protein RadC [Oscillospiraceae bacterium]